MILLKSVSWVVMGVKEQLTVDSWQLAVERRSRPLWLRGSRSSVSWESKFSYRAVVGFTVDRRKEEGSRKRGVGRVKGKNEGEEGRQKTQKEKRKRRRKVFLASSDIH